MSSGPQNPEEAGFLRCQEMKGLVHEHLIHEHEARLLSNHLAKHVPPDEEEELPKGDNLILLSGRSLQGKSPKASPRAKVVKTKGERTRVERTKAEHLSHRLEARARSSQQRHVGITRT